jgi:hypothetical protein
LNVNLDGEPTVVKQFRVECRRRVLPVHLSDSPLLLNHQPPFDKTAASTPAEDLLS